jgi:hypothetical protein
MLYKVMRSVTGTRRVWLPSEPVRRGAMSYADRFFDVVGQVHMEVIACGACSASVLEQRLPILHNPRAQRICWTDLRTATRPTGSRRAAHTRTLVRARR